MFKAAWMKSAKHVFHMVDLMCLCSVTSFFGFLFSVFNVSGKTVYFVLE